MSPLALLLLFTFLQSFGTILLQRGGYFYTEHEMGFSATQNLLLALSMGVVYVAGALPSHFLSRRFGERRVLTACLLGQVACAGAMFAWPRAVLLLPALNAYQFCNGMAWPIVESYVGAGRSPRRAASAIGAFNITWSCAVPAALWCSGPIIEHFGAGLFAASALVGLVTLGLAGVFPKAPAHHADDHPDRPPAGQVVDWRRLLLSARWSLVLAYAMLFILAPLLPEVFKGLGYTVSQGTFLAGLIDLARAAAFVLMIFTHAWHGRRDLLAGVALVLPLGFLLALFGVNLGPALGLGLTGTTALIVAGEVFFGLIAGVAYYAALYYAMVTHNASVDAGGWHEALIGSGFTLGPAVALLGQALGGGPAGLALGIAPMVLLFAVGANRALRVAERPRMASMPQVDGPTR